MNFTFLILVILHSVTNIDDNSHSFYIMESRNQKLNYVVKKWTIVTMEHFQ